MLVAKLREGTGVTASNGVVTGVLSTIGELARVVGLSITLLQFRAFYTVSMFGSFKHILIFYHFI